MLQLVCRSDQVLTPGAYATSFIGFDPVHSPEMFPEKCSLFACWIFEISSRYDCPSSVATNNVCRLLLFAAMTARCVQAPPAHHVAALWLRTPRSNQTASFFFLHRFLVLTRIRSCALSATYAATMRHGCVRGRDRSGSPNFTTTKLCYSSVQTAALVCPYHQWT